MAFPREMRYRSLFLQVRRKRNQTEIQIALQLAWDNESCRKRRYREFSRQFLRSENEEQKQIFGYIVRFYNFVYVGDGVDGL